MLKSVAGACREADIDHSIGLATSTLTTPARVAKGVVNIADAAITI